MNKNNIKLFICKEQKFAKMYILSDYV